MEKSAAWSAFLSLALLNIFCFTYLNIFQLYPLDLRVSVLNNIKLAFVSLLYLNYICLFKRWFRPLGYLTYFHLITLTLVLLSLRLLLRVIHFNFTTVLEDILSSLVSLKWKWLPEEALQMARVRGEMKGKGERERHTQLNAVFQRIASRDKKPSLNEQCKKNTRKQ